VAISSVKNRINYWTEVGAGWSRVLKTEQVPVVTQHLDYGHAIALWVTSPYYPDHTERA